MREIKAIVRPDRLDDVIEALHGLGDLPGVTVSTVRGFGRREPQHAGGPMSFGEIEMNKLEIVVPDALVDRIVATIIGTARTGRAGDGKIFVTRVDQAVRIRSGEREEAGR